MSSRTAVIIVLVLSVLGMAMSGYLTYKNLWGPEGCSTNSFLSCGGAKAVKIFGLPTCIYGFFMYLIVFVLAIATLIKPLKSLMCWLIGFGSLGTAFSGFLSFYELAILKIEFRGLPSCVYGLFLYIGILIFSIVAYKKIATSIMQTPTESTPTAGA